MSEGEMKELKDRPALEARLREFHARPHLEVLNAR